MDEKLQDQSVTMRPVFTETLVLGKEHVDYPGKTRTRTVIARATGTIIIEPKILIFRFRVLDDSQSEARAFTSLRVDHIQDSCSNEYENQMYAFTQALRRIQALADQNFARAVEYAKSLGSAYIPGFAEPVRFESVVDLETHEPRPVKELFYRVEMYPSSDSDLHFSLEVEGQNKCLPVRLFNPTQDLKGRYTAAQAEIVATWWRERTRSPSRVWIVPFDAPVTGKPPTDQ